ncbi:uncharacterized protein LOC115293256 [Suricata suricatta]|uniref:uncharacterized protein LOC115293256 n=1 Tax=Suricata suricatta TaxID=37032 RepID=UPI001155F335|nr:uncharacterized protein LOC115293256 [Suricata suricatta]
MAALPLLPGRVLGARMCARPQPASGPSTWAFFTPKVEVRFSLRSVQRLAGRPAENALSPVWDPGTQPLPPPEPAVRTSSLRGHVGASGAGQEEGAKVAPTREREEAAPRQRPPVVCGGFLSLHMSFGADAGPPAAAAGRAEEPPPPRRRPRAPPTLPPRCTLGLVCNSAYFKHADQYRK